MVNDVCRRSHNLRTSWKVNRNEWGVRVRVLKPHTSGKGLSGKAKAKTGIGKSDLPGLQGGPRKCDFVFLTRCTRLGSIPTRRFRRVQVALPAGSQVEDMKFGLSVLTMKETHDG